MTFDFVERRWRLFSRGAFLADDSETVLTYHVGLGDHFVPLIKQAEAQAEDLARRAAQRAERATRKARKSKLVTGQGN